MSFHMPVSSDVPTVQLSDARAHSLSLVSTAAAVHGLIPVGGSILC